MNLERQNTNRRKKRNFFFRHSTMKPPIVVQTSNSRFRHFLVNFREFLNRHENAPQRGGIYKSWLDGKHLMFKLELFCNDSDDHMIFLTEFFSNDQRLLCSNFSGKDCNSPILKINIRRNFVPRACGMSFRSLSYANTERFCCYTHV